MLITGIGREGVGVGEGVEIGRRREVILTLSLNTILSY